MALYNPILGNVPADNSNNRLDFFETIIPDKDNPLGKIRRPLLVKDVTQLPLNAGALASLTGNSLSSSGTVTPSETFIITVPRNMVIKEILITGLSSFTPTTSARIDVYFNNVLAFYNATINTSGQVLDFTGYYYDCMFYQNAEIRIEITRVVNLTVTQYFWEFKGIYIPD